MSQTILKKMSAKGICGNVKEVVKSISEDGGRAQLYNVYGVATGLIPGEHPTHGTYLGFSGNFGAINQATGEEFVSTKCFLPDPMPGLIEAAMAKSESVEFALQVDVIRRDNLAVGYEYLVKPLIEAQEADPLAHLKKIAVSKVAQLEAPKAEVAEEPKAKKKAS